MNYRRLRGILLNLQDRLNEDDRKRLNFFLGNDIPRHIRDDPSFGGALSPIESLFDQDKIKQNDVTLLIKVFNKTGCISATQHLEDKFNLCVSILILIYLEQMNVVNEPVQSLSISMPSIIDQSLQDEENDEITEQTRI